MDKKMLDLLYRSMDVSLSAEEKQLLDMALLVDPDLHTEKEELLKAREIAKTVVFKFEPFFVERVIKKINSRIINLEAGYEFFESLAYIFKRVAIIGAVTIAILFSAELFNKKDGVLVNEQTITKMTLDDVLTSAFSTSLEESL